MKNKISVNVLFYELNIFKFGDMNRELSSEGEHGVLLKENFLIGKFNALDEFKGFKKFVKSFINFIDNYYTELENPDATVFGKKQKGIGTRKDFLIEAITDKNKNDFDDISKQNENDFKANSFISDEHLMVGIPLIAGPKGSFYIESKEGKNENYSGAVRRKFFLFLKFDLINNRIILSFTGYNNLVISEGIKMMVLDYFRINDLVTDISPLYPKMTSNSNITLGDTIVTYYDDPAVLRSTGRWKYGIKRASILLSQVQKPQIGAEKYISESFLAFKENRSIPIEVKEELENIGFTNHNDDEFWRKLAYKFKYRINGDTKTWNPDHGEYIIERVITLESEHYFDNLDINYSRIKNKIKELILDVSKE